MWPDGAQGTRVGLGVAAQRGDVQSAHAILEHAPWRINEKNHIGWSVVAIAAIYGHLPMVEYLVEKGADVNLADVSGYTPLIHSINRNSSQIVEYLLQQGADLEARDNLGRTPLIYAARRKRFSLVQYLVEQGAAVNACEKLGATPLKAAAMGMQPEMVDYLCAHGAEVNNKRRDGTTALHMVGSFELMGSNPDVLHHGAIQTMATLINHGADLHLTNPSGETTLQVLATRFMDGHEDQLMTQIHLVQLDIAIRTRNLIELRRLVENEGVNEITGDHLIDAARSGDMILFEYLVEHGATLVSGETGQSDDTDKLEAMLRRRQDWIDQAAGLAARWHLPLTAIRVIHEHVIGFNWSAVCEALSTT